MRSLGSDNIARINTLWGIHEHGTRDPSIHSECLAFVLDERFIREVDGRVVENRLGMSFGHNPFTPEMAVGFVPPPIQPGPYIFGLHWVGTQNGKLTIFDMWYDGFRAESTGDVEPAIERAKALLEGISDEQYLRSFSREHQSEPLERALAANIVVIEEEAF